MDGDGEGHIDFGGKLNPRLPVGSLERKGTSSLMKPIVLQTKDTSTTVSAPLSVLVSETYHLFLGSRK